MVVMFNGRVTGGDCVFLVLGFSVCLFLSKGCQTVRYQVPADQSDQHSYFVFVAR
jgi:hypothetical protein